MSEQEQLENGEDQGETLDLKGMIGKALDDQIAEQDEGDIEEEVEAEAAEEESVEEETEEDPGEAAGEEEDVSEDDAEEEEPFAAPKHYSEDDRKVFEDLPRDKAEWLMARAKDLDDKHAQRMREAANVQREHDAMTEAFEPVKELLTRHGLDRPTAVRRLVGAQTHLMTQPADALALLATQYARQDPQEAVRKVAAALGVDLGNVASVEGTDEFLDEKTAQRIQQLDQRLAQTESALTAQATNSRDAQVAQAQKVIDDFREAKDDKGDPLHPHFERVQDVMASFVASGIDMAEAYKRAVMSDPELAEAEFQKRLKASAGKREASRKRDVEKAKKASRNITGDRATTKAEKEKPASVKDALRQSLDDWDAEHAS